ncbi:MAG: hypothetical protein NTW29_03730 [Bacteroidetes bacterium]|nr:hypothetical protein [Bacteroidota bacterium]
MRKLYALLTGLFMALLATHATPLPPDVANFSFTIDHPNIDMTFINTSSLGTKL